MRQATLLISATCLNLLVACANLSCVSDAASIVPIFGFDLEKGHLYSGKKNKPNQTVKLNDPKLEKQFVSMRTYDWVYVLTLLNQCAERKGYARLAESGEETLAEMSGQ
jgi:hypothetical protein